MKKTLVITLEFPPQIGGIAAYLEQFVGSLPVESVVVLAPMPDKQTEGDDDKPYTLIRRRLLARFFWPRWLRLVFTAWRICRREEIEQIHVHHILPVGYVAWILSFICRVPYIIFSHGTDIAGLSGRRWKKRMAIFVAKRAERVIANSENLKTRLISVFPELTEFVSVLYPCPDKNFFTPTSPQILDELRHRYALEGKQVLLSVSRLDEGKGFPHLIRLMPDILRHMPHVVWFIIGDGPKKEEVLRLIQEKNLQNIVRFVGEIPHEDIKQYYNLADMFILLTHPDEGREEGLGLVFLEAAAAGLPVVAGRSGGVDEAVAHGQTGFVIDIHQQPGAVTETIVKILQHPEYGQQLGQAGRQRMAREFIWEHQLERIEEWL